MGGEGGGEEGSLPTPIFEWKSFCDLEKVGLLDWGVILCHWEKGR